MEESREKKSIVGKVINILLWIILFAWMALCLMDYNRVQNRKEPKFCIKKSTIKYEDGEVINCLGLGYRVYSYKRASFNGIEYGPFWSKNRSENE